MSAEATAYVTQLRQCPDGAELTAAHKAILWCLADRHNRSTRRCDPGMALLEDESRVPQSSLKRALGYLEDHCIIKRVFPENQGRGKLSNFVFLALDAPDEYAHKLRQLSKGVQAEPLFCPPQRGPEGAQDGAERGSEGAQIGTRNKEQPLTKYKPLTGRAPARAREPALSQAERDTLDLKRFQARMQELTRAHVGTGADPEKLWRRQVRQAAYDAGIAPARIVELLKQHYPNDPNIPLLYPKMATA